MATTPYIEHGDQEMQLMGGRLRQRGDSLDTVTVEWQSPREGAFRLGGLLPGYTAMYIEELEREDDGPLYLFRLSAVGLSGGDRRDKGYPKIIKNLDGFDDASDSWITSNKDKYQPGDVMEGHENMVCMEAPHEPLNKHLFKVTPKFRGIISEKPYKRRISVNERIINPTNEIFVDLPGGWEDMRKGQVSLPQIVVSDQLIQIGAPDTSSIPGNEEPPDAPAINTGITLVGGELTWSWPYGWKIAGIDGEYIAGTNVWMGTKSWEYVWPAVWT